MSMPSIITAYPQHVSSGPTSSFVNNRSNFRTQQQALDRQMRMFGSDPVQSTGDSRSTGRIGYLKSQIPGLKRSASKASKPNASLSAENQTRWDEYLGEPTKSAAGKPAQVRPSAYNEPLQEMKNYRVEISSGNERPSKNSWGDRAVKMGRDALALDTRPPWKGGSGRTALADPVQDTAVPTRPSNYTAVRRVPKLDLSTESGSDNSLVNNNGGKMATNGVPRQISPRDTDSWEEDDISPISPSEYDQDFGDAEVSPISPEMSRDSYYLPPHQSKMKNIRPVSPSAVSVTSVISRKPVGSQPSSSVRGSMVPSGSRKPTPTSHARPHNQLQSHFSWSTQADTNVDAMSVRTPETPRVTDLQHSEESNSRFSWTTVNSNTTYQQDSPPPSPPPVRIAPLDTKSWRNRQAVNMPDHPPTPPPHDELIENSHDKSLPQLPTVSKTMTHVDNLIARRENLTIQRRNVQKIIHELKQIDLASPLDVDWRTRKENKKKLDEHQARLEEVEREEHEVGRSIARTRRRAEREEGIDSGLWVRRVTG